MQGTRWGIRQVTPAADTAISLDEAKLALRVDGNREDIFVRRCIAAAQELAGSRTNRPVMTSTWRMTLDRFPCGPIRLPRGNVTAISSLTYVDGDGAVQTLDSSLYAYDLDREPVEICPAYGETWPTARIQPASIKVTFVAGAETADDVLDDIKMAMHLLVGHWFEHREAVGQVSGAVELAFKDLTDPNHLHVVV